MPFGGAGDQTADHLRVDNPLYLLTYSHTEPKTLSHHGCATVLVHPQCDLRPLQEHFRSGTFSPPGVFQTLTKSPAYRFSNHGTPRSVAHRMEFASEFTFSEEE